MSIYVYAFGKNTRHVSLPDQWRPVAERLVEEAFASEGLPVEVFSGLLRDRLPKAQELLGSLPRARFVTVEQAHKNLEEFVQVCERHQEESGEAVTIVAVSSQPIKSRKKKEREASKA